MLVEPACFPGVALPRWATLSRRSPRKSVDPYTRCHENFVLVRSNRAITVAARNRRLALVTNILSRDSDGAVPVAARGYQGRSPGLVGSGIESDSPYRAMRNESYLTIIDLKQAVIRAIYVPIPSGRTPAL